MFAESSGNYTFGADGVAVEGFSGFYFGSFHFHPARVRARRRKYPVLHFYATEAQLWVGVAV